MVLLRAAILSPITSKEMPARPALFGSLSRTQVAEQFTFYITDNETCSATSGNES